ncbi:MAG: PglZ domain-containing protein [Marinilabiliaceae bacterium]|nr:PglZ domain-containing protein [Marinilabiliaceae bacterium]
MANILWIDDEIDLLTPHCLFLAQKGHNVFKATDGPSAIEMLQNNEIPSLDIVFLDEQMPGLSGLDVLLKIKQIRPAVPVVMVTKSEEEDIMNQAIGAQIADYLIKPLQPSQLLLAVKKFTESKQLVFQTVQSQYQTQFQDISFQISQCNSFSEWAEIYKRLIFWEIQLAEGTSFSADMSQILLSQKQDATAGFVKFIRKNYESWIAKPSIAPLMSHRILPDRILPHLDAGEKIVFIVIDNFRLDQWETIRPLLTQEYDIQTELYCSILPTATMYARNSLFSGLLPSQISEMYPAYWPEENSSESSQNQYERELLSTFFQRYRKNYVHAYYKANDATSGQHIVDIFNRYRHNDLVALVYNFVDQLSHARSEVKAIKELSADEAAYRSITKSWFQHDPLSQMLSLLSKTKDLTIMITTDHGSIRVHNPQKILAGADVNTNLRYKTGRNLNCNTKQVLTTSDSKLYGLPKTRLIGSYAFAEGEDFFVYNNNTSHYIDLYSDTFQHGGVSMEEMIIPLVTLKPKNE